MRVTAIVTGLLLLLSMPLLADKPRPATTSNNDSCDIAVLPAATLLLPYFQVETTAQVGAGATTLFTITNTSRYPQIAHVTVWTDWAFPVLAFNLFLTGYDVQGINLYDVIVRGLVVPGAPPGTTITTVPGSPAVPVLGATPLSNTANPNFVTSGPLGVSTTCAGLPGFIGSELSASVLRALTTGIGHAGGANCGSTRVGSSSGSLAKGYLTVDVVSYCSTQLPTDSDGSYFTGETAPLLFDNVLLGDYQQLGTVAGTVSGFDAEGSPMVHIRAIPEGGLSGASGAEPVETALPFTFYDVYTPDGARAMDRRQPLPSVWAARYLQGGSAGFATNLEIWREGLNRGVPNCSGSTGALVNAAIELTDTVRFDEHENSYGFSNLCITICPRPTPSLPATSRTPSTASIFPVLTGTDLGGWLYLNLSNNSQMSGLPASTCNPVLSAQRVGFGSSCKSADLGSSGSRTTSQNWVVASLFGAIGINRLSVAFDAAALGNGCTPAPARGANVGPSTQRDGLVCPSNTSPSNCSPATRVATPNP